MEKADPRGYFFLLKDKKRVSVEVIYFYSGYRLVEYCVPITDCCHCILL